MSNDIQTPILLAALSERYQALRAIRERVQTVGLAVIGFLLGAGGWLIQSQRCFSCVEKGVALFSILGAVGILRFIYLADLHRGFRSQQRVSARIEKTLGMYAAGKFDQEPDSIYPESWSKAGQDDGSGGFFQSTYLIIYFGSAFLVIVITFIA